MFKESGLCFNIYLRQCTHNTFAFSTAIKVVNRIQKPRKKAGLEPTDLVEVFIKPHDADEESLEKILNSQYSAVLAHCVLDEKLHKPGWVGCILCIVSSALVALHAPKEREMEYVKQIWHYATQPAIVSPVYFVLFTIFTILASMIMLKEWHVERGTQFSTEMLGFVVIIAGTFPPKFKRIR